MMERLAELIQQSRWTAPSYIRKRSPDENDRVRDKYKILVEGDDIPPPIATFKVSPHRIFPMLVISRSLIIGLL